MHHLALLQNGLNSLHTQSTTMETGGGCVHVKQHLRRAALRTQTYLHKLRDRYELYTQFTQS